MKKIFSILFVSLSLLFVQNSFGEPTLCQLVSDYKEYYLGAGENWRRDMIRVAFFPLFYFKGATSINWEAGEGNLYRVNKLLNDGYDINIQDSDGWTPLMTAVARRQFEMVRLLLYWGANKDIVDCEGETALDLAVSKRAYDEDRPIELIEDIIYILNGPFECPVCFNDYIFLPKTKCGHRFCPGCIRDWRTRDNSCPMCRADLG